MSWLSKKFEELTAQVNPFDNGRTAATVRAARTQPQPAQTSRSNISVGVARPQGTVRVAAPTPTPAIRVGNRRITQSPTMTNAPGQGIAPSQTIQNIGKGLVKSVTEPYTTLSTGIAETLAYNTPTQQRLRQAQNNLQNLNAQNIAKASQVLRDPNVDMATKERYAKLANSQANMASQTFDQANQRNQEIQSRTDPVKGAASVGSIGLDIATLGVGTGSTSALKTAGLQGAKQFGKRLAIESAKTGLVGAAGGALSPYVTNGRNATIGDVAKGAAYGAAVGAAVPGISYGASTLKAPTTRLVSSVKTNMAPLNEGGFIELGRTPKNIHQEDQNIMSDFIDYARGRYKPDQKTAYQLELDASRIAERYGLKMPPTLTGLADVFDKRLRKEFKPSIWKDEAGSVGPNIRSNDPLESLKQEARTVEKFGWKSEATPQGTKLINRNGKHVATITEKNGRYTASYTDGSRIATSTDANKLAEDVARKTFYAQEVSPTQNTGGTLRPDKTPEPFKNTARQGEISPERAKTTQANVDSMKASMEFDKSPTPKKAYHSTASLEIEGGKLRASPDGVMGEGVYLHTDQNTAKYAGAMQGDGNIADQQALDVALKTDNLYKWAGQEYPTPEQIAIIKKRGYDGVYKKGGEIVVFDPNKIELSKATQSQPPTPVESLKQEARKYKSADEFVNSQRQVYRGGQPLDESMVSSSGIPLTTRPETADYYKGSYKNGVREDFVLRPDAKIKKVTGANTEGERFNALAKAEKQGYDGVDFGGTESEIRLTNSSKLITKQQLTDLYNQATQSQPPKSPVKTDPREARSIAQKAYKDAEALKAKYQNKPKSQAKLSDAEKKAVDKQYNDLVKTYTDYYKENGGFDTGTGWLSLKDEKGVDLYKESATQSQPPKSPLTVEKNIETAKKQAQAVEKLKRDKKITPDDEGYWSTPIKGEPKAKMPDVKDVNGVTPKEGDTIKFSALAQMNDAPNKTGTSTIRWVEPQIANASGEVIPGKWVGNGLLDNGIPFEIVKRADGTKPTVKKPTLQDALDGKSTKGVILNESKPLSDGSKVVTKARKGANGLETYQERVDKFTDKPVSKAKQREMISQIKPTALDALESKDLDKLTKPDFRDLTNKYLGSEKSGEIKATQVARDYNTRHGKLTAKQKNEVIFGKDDPTFKVKDASVNKAIKELQETYDDAYNYFTKQKGLKFGYQHDYYPREYVNVKTGAEVTAAEYKLLQTGSSRMKGRTSNELAEWKLKFRDPAEALQSYHQNLERAAAGQKYIADLEQNGFVMKSTEPVKGMRPIVAEGMQSDGYIYYAKPKVADKLNKIFGSQEASGFFEKAVEKARDFNSFTQSFVLSGGVPNTPINAFGIMQLMKNGMALHPVQGGKAFLLGMSRKSSTKFFDNHANYLKMMAEEGIDVRYDYSLKPNSGIYRVKKAAEEKGNLAAIGQAWDEITNDATFGRFMPALEVLHFKGVHDGLIRKGVDPAKARQTAAKATANFYGKNTMVKEASRSKVATDAAGAALFAPRFRESMVNFWGKNVSALKPGNITKKEYRDNLKFLASAGAVFATMDAVNKELNGTHMWDNPDGKKDKLLIPNGPDGKYIGVPFLPSISTVPRNVAMGAYNLATGKPEEAGKNISSFFSIPLKTATEVGTNENYFGQRIVDEDSSTAERLGQMGSHIAKNNLQPWIREGMNIAGQGLPEGIKKSLGVKDKSGFETVSNALEAPLRFYDPKYFKKAPQNFANGAYSAGEKANPSDAYDTVSKAFTLRKGQLPNLDKYDSEAVKNAAKQVNKDFQAELKSYGLPTDNLKFDTVLAKDYADFKKNIKGKNEIEVAKQTASFLKTTYKGQYLDDTTKSFYNLGDNDMRNYITSGKLTKKQMDKVIELDDLLTKSGLQKYPQVGKILRSELGYGLTQTSRSSGRSTGRSTRSGGRKTSSRKKYGLFGFSDGLPMASTNKSLRSLLEKAIVS